MSRGGAKTDVQFVLSADAAKAVAGLVSVINKYEELGKSAQRAGDRGESSGRKMRGELSGAEKVVGALNAKVLSIGASLLSVGALASVFRQEMDRQMKLATENAERSSKRIQDSMRLEFGGPAMGSALMRQLEALETPLATRQERLDIALAARGAKPNLANEQVLQFTERAANAKAIVPDADEFVVQMVQLSEIFGGLNTADLSDAALQLRSMGINIGEFMTQAKQMKELGVFSGAEIVGLGAAAQRSEQGTRALRGVIEAIGADVEEGEVDAEATARNRVWTVKPPANAEEAFRRLTPEQRKAALFGGDLRGIPARRRPVVGAFLGERPLATGEEFFAGVEGEDIFAQRLEEGMMTARGRRAASIASGAVARDKIRSERENFDLRRQLFQGEYNTLLERPGKLNFLNVAPRRFAFNRATGMGFDPETAASVFGLRSGSSRLEGIRENVGIVKAAGLEPGRNFRSHITDAGETQAGVRVEELMERLVSINEEVLVSIREMNSKSGATIGVNRHMSN